MAGKRGEYRWLTCANDTYMGTIVNRCPEVLLGRYVAITSIESGVPRLTEQQQQAGWECRGGVAYSRAIQSVDELFYQRDGSDSPGYDEWYVFETSVDLGEISLNHPFIGAATRQPEHLMTPRRGMTSFAKCSGCRSENFDPNPTSPMGGIG